MSDERIKIDWGDLDRGTSGPPPHRSFVPPASTESDRSVFSRLDEGEAGAAPGSLHRRSWFYMTIAGGLAGLLAGGVAEVILDIDGQSDDASGIVQTLALTGLLGLVVAAALASIESWVVGASRQAAQALLVGGLVGLGCGLVAGVVGGMVFGFVIQIVLLLELDSEAAVFIGLVAARGIAWAVLGAVCGVACGVAGTSVRKAMLGGIGGGIGGLVGGLAFDPIGLVTFQMHADSAVASRLVGFVVLAAMTGLFISLVERMARESWLEVAGGRLVGKQFILYRPRTRIGSSPDSEVFLFKDPAVPPLAATIERTPSGAILGAHGTVLVNHLPFVGRHRLRSGDILRVGETTLRYQERR